PRPGRDAAIDSLRSVARCSAHCATVATALKPSQRHKYPRPNNSTENEMRPVRLACAPANRSSMGAAEPVIMPIIITLHIAKVRSASTVVHGRSTAIPMAAIILAYSSSDEGCLERWMRYAHESVVRTARQIEMT